MINNILRNNIQKELSNIINNYNLVIKEVSNNLILLCGQYFAIGISLDRDGLSYLYYDLGGKKNNCYNLGLYLLQKRREKLNFVKEDKSDKSLEEYLSHNLLIFSKNLESACGDILSGDKAWLKQYSWPVNDISSEVLAAI